MEQGRLFKIVYHLLDKGRATAPELAEKFEVSVRTIYRDLDAISAAGIPIYTVQGKGGGIFILPEFVLEKSLLTPQEKEQILMALQGLAAARYPLDGAVQDKLRALFGAREAPWIDVDFSDWSNLHRGLFLD
uniref:helix-turn-helix transcriptional regulator n=1 Tax=Gemmiger formicilis TaxID=745368 RepID=UPI003FF0B0BF